jgi:cation diffusion facilitator family transporter
MFKITQFLDRHIKKKASVEDPNFRSKVATIETVNSLIVNFIIFAIKLWLGLMANSISVIADAFNSFGDMFSSLISLFGFYLAKSPPDEEHPFGHSRIEFITSIILSMILIFTGLQVIIASLKRIQHVEVITVTPMLLVIIILTMFAKEYLAQVSKLLGNYINSSVLKANFWNYRFDGISTLIILVSLGFARFGIYAVDGYLAIAASFMIIYSGIEVLKDASSDLLGKAPSPEFLEQVRQVMTIFPEIAGYHDLVVHSYGHIKTVSLHVELEETMPFITAHDIAEAVEETINKRCNVISTTIHIDPISKLEGDDAPLANDLATYVEESNRIKSIHDLRKVGKNIILFDLVLDHTLTPVEELQTKRKMINDFRRLYPEVSIVPTIEPKYHV